MIIARYSAHIQSDIQRNWSSWNFGKDGFEGTREEFEAFIASATEEEPICISGFELYAYQVKRTKFGELTPNYWVAIDNRGGLSCDIIEGAETLEEALQMIEANPGLANGSGDGSFIDCSEAKVLYSEFDEGEFGLHILEVQD